MMNYMKVLFVCYGLGIGGIEKCLVNLINAMPEKDFEIDVLLMNPEYDLVDQLKRKVNILDRFGVVMNTTNTINEIQQHGGILNNIGVFFKYCVFRVLVKLQKKPWLMFKRLPIEYDVIIAYSHSDYVPYYVIDKLSAKKKVMWYHNGAYNCSGKQYKRDRKYYKKFDNVVAVSNDCATVMSDKFNFNEKQLIVLRNFYDIEDILDKSNAFIPESYGNHQVDIATVGRLTSEKGADIATEACLYLKEQGYDICWHWIGSGNQQIAVKSDIENKQLETNFLLEGNQINPYPYIKNCNIYVQPSYYEAYSTTVAEAKILFRPIVTTDVGGMRDQIKDGVNGYIVKIDSKSIAMSIVELIKNRDIQISFSNELKNEKYIDDNLKSYLSTVFLLEEKDENKKSSTQDS